MTLNSDELSRFLSFSLKLECEKLASEKTEMHRHYIMVRGISDNISHNSKM